MVESSRLRPLDSISGEKSETKRVIDSKLGEIDKIFAEKFTKGLLEKIFDKKKLCVDGAETIKLKIDDIDVLIANMREAKTQFVRYYQEIFDQLSLEVDLDYLRDNQEEQNRIEDKSVDADENKSTNKFEAKKNNLVAENNEMLLDFFDMMKSISSIITSLSILEDLQKNLFELPGRRSEYIDELQTIINNIELMVDNIESIYNTLKNRFAKK